MRWFRSVAGAAKSQRGFTIAEVLIAATIMVSASLGLLSLFNGALQLSGLSATIKDAQRFASTVDERLRSLQFYVPYSSTVGKQDFDDYFYCPDATPRSPMTVNSPWLDQVKVPEVPFTMVTDPRFNVTVKMVYVNDDLTESDMATGFGNGPVAPTSGGSDKPVSSGNKPFHMIKYQIKVAWKVNGQFTATSNYTYMGLMTDTQFAANLGVSSMINNTSDASKKGTIVAAGSTDIVSAPNNASAIDVKIIGFGFKAGETITGWLMKTGVEDIPISGLTRISDTELRGQITLDSGWSGGGGPPPWNPRRDPGKWSVRVNVGTGYAAAYDAFIVQFPQPIRVTDAGSLSPKTATDTQSNLAITCTGSNILNLNTGPSPYGNYAGATIRLVRQDNPSYIITVTSGTLTYTGDSYGGGTDSVRGQFDLRGKSPGAYWVEAWNCKNRNTPVADGNVCSPHDAANMTLTISQVSPIPSNAYVTGSDGGEVYVASGEKRHFGFRTRNYKYTVRIDGTDMGSVSLARLGIGGIPADGTGTRTVDASSVVADAGNTFVTATFDLNTVEDGYARTDDTYDWWVYVENSLTTQAKGSVSNIFQVRKPRPILYKDAEYVSGGGGGIYHNYSGVVVRLTGECFDSSTYNINYDSGSYGWGSTTYTVGSSDGGMAKGAPSAANDYTTWDTTLNLIHCRNTSNNIWVLMADGTTDNNFTSTKESPSRIYKFYVLVTTTDNSTLKAQAQSTTAANSAVYVDNSFHDCYFNWYYRWRWFYGANYETNAAVARAQRTVGHAMGDQEGQAMFTLRGQGFKDAIVGATSPVQLLRWYTDGWGSWWWEELCGQDNVNVANPASAAAALTDRQNLYVTVQLPNHGMPKEDASGEINCGSNSFPNRFNLQEVLTNG